MTEPLLGQALVEEATKKSGIIWVKGSGLQGAGPEATGATGATGTERPLWYVWHEGAVLLVGDGPGEQPLPGLADGSTAEVTVRSKDKGGRLVAWTAAVGELPARSAEWEAAVAELKGKRLNAPDAEVIAERWARECRVLRLAPQDAIMDLPDGSLAAPPLPTGATTRQPAPAALGRLLFRRKR